MQINVSGGTNAGWRVVKPKPNWFCQYCEEPSKYSKCLGCGAKKP